MTWELRDIRRRAGEGDAGMSTQDRIRFFIRDEILFEEEGEGPPDDQPLLEGLVDSLGLMQLVAFIEEEFDIEVGDADMTSGNFRTVSSITSFVEARRGVAAPQA
jgi:acyl carrier protein